MDHHRGLPYPLPSNGDYIYVDPLFPGLSSWVAPSEILEYRDTVEVTRTMSVGQEMVPVGWDGFPLAEELHYHWQQPSMEGFHGSANVYHHHSIPNSYYITPPEPEVVANLDLMNIMPLDPNYCGYSSDMASGFGNHDESIDQGGFFY